MATQIQNKILEAVDIIVKENINNAKYTSSNVGIVKSVNGFDCIVEIQDNEYSCILMEHLHDWIQEDDIVIVQDLYNNNSKRTVIGKIGSSRPVSLTFEDSNIKKGISGVDAVIDEETGENENAIIEIEE